MVCRSCGRLVSVRESRCPLCGAVSPSLFGLGPRLARLGLEIDPIYVLTGLLLFLYFMSLVGDPQGIRNGGLTFLAPSGEMLVRLGASGKWPVLAADRWWTPLSAGLLHGDALHILFNVLWLRQLGADTVALFGASRTVLLLTLSSVVGFLLSTFAPTIRLLVFTLGGGLFSVGASAAIFGLLGALLWYSRKSGARALTLHLWGWAAFLLAWGLINPMVDNYAHLGGFAGGFLGAWLLNPARPERPWHTLAALACALAAIGAVVASVLAPLPLG